MDHAAVHTGGPAGEPAAVRTFLIADVRGYTRFTADHGDEAAAALATRFAALARDAVKEYGGEVIELRGDEALAVFTSTRLALRAAVELQNRFAAATQDDPALPLKVGIGLDAGEAISVEGGFRGASLNRAARLCSLAGPGDVLASDGLLHLAGPVNGLTFIERGTAQVKGFAEPLRVYGVLAEGGQEPSSSQSPASPEQHLPIGGFLGSLPAGFLVGRDRELEAALAAVDSVQQGEGRLLLLAGEPGAGKTRLAQEITLHLRNRGFLVAAGTCFEPRQSVPYYPFLDVLAELFAVAAPHIRSQVPARWAQLGRLLPESGPAPPANPSGDQDEQERLFRSIAGFVQALAQTAPLALLLDDLHWADQSSLDLLVHLARHTRGNRVLLLGTYRDVEVGRQHPLQQTVHDLHRQGLSERVLVRRLDQDNTTRLIAATLGEEDISSEFTSLVYRHTEGNPFFTREVLRALVDQGDVYRKNGRWDRREIEEIDVPESVRAVVGQRLSHLRPEAQEVLSEASVLGHTFSFDDLQAVTDRDEDAIDAALSEAIAAALVHEAGKDDYAFSHGLIHGTLYADLSPRRRRKLHRAAGDVLERLTGRKREQRVTELAWHFVEGDEPERALPYVMQAGDQAESVFAHAEAASRFGTAVELSQDIGDQRAEAQALEKLGSTLEIQSRPDQSLQVLTRAAEINREGGDLEGEGRVTAGIASALMHLGRQMEAVASLRSMLARLESQEPGAALARLSVQLGAVLYGSGQYPEAWEAIERAGQVADLIGDRVTRVAAENYRGSVLMQTGKVEEARQVFEAILPLSGTINDLGVRAHTVNDLAFVCLISGRLVEAERYLAQSLELQRQKASPVMIAFALTGLSWAYFYRGKWQEARSANQEGLDLIRDLPPSWQLPFLLYLEGLIAAAEGDVEAATEHLQRAIDQSDGGHVMLPLVHRVLAEMEILRGDPESARARLQPFMEGEGEQGFYATMALPTLGWAYLELGEVDRADGVLSHLLGAAGNRFPLVLVDALRVQGMVLARRGQQSGAERAFDEAIALARRMEYPYAEAAALYQLGLMEMRRGDRAQALESLIAARTTFERLGAQPDVERTAQVLAGVASG